MSKISDMNPAGPLDGSELIEVVQDGTNKRIRASDLTAVGKSAYDIAVQAGFSGSESQWLASLKGQPGTPGGKGEPGTPGQNGTNGQQGIQGIQGQQGIQGLKGNTGEKGQDGDGLLLIKNIVSSYTLQISDAKGMLIRVNNIAPVTITIANDTVELLPMGASVIISRNGTGEVSMVADEGVTIDTPDSYSIARRYGKITAIKVAPNHWEIEGNLASA